MKQTDITYISDRDIEKCFDEKIKKYIDSYEDSPYLEFLVDIYSDFEKNDRINLLRFLYNLELEEMKGEKDLFPLKYLLVYYHNLQKNYYAVDDQFLIGGWALFFKIWSVEREGALYKFRGSHDIDQVGKDKRYMHLWKKLYPSGLEIKSHLPNKYSFYAEDEVIVKEPFPSKRQIEIDFYYPDKNDKIYLSDNEFDYNSIDKEVVLFYGIPICFIGKESFLKLKSLAGRRKDLEDIQIYQDYDKN